MALDTGGDWVVDGCPVGGVVSGARVIVPLLVCTAADVRAAVLNVGVVSAAS